MKKIIFPLVIFLSFSIAADNSLVARNHSNSNIRVLFAAVLAADCDSDYDLPSGTSTDNGCKFPTLKPGENTEHVFDWWNTTRTMRVYDEAGNTLADIESFDNEYFIIYGEYPAFYSWDTTKNSNPFDDWAYAQRRWVMEPDGTIKYYKRKDTP